MNLDTIVAEAKKQAVLPCSEKSDLISSLISSSDTKIWLTAGVGVQSLLYNIAMQSTKHDVPREIASGFTEKHALVIADKIVTPDNLPVVFDLIYLGMLIGKAVEQSQSLSQLVM